MIDFHTHCLPGMDDGAADVAESIALLRDSLQQGVTTVVATPHFYPGEEKVSAFLERREAATQQLQQAIDADAVLAGNIRLLTGAEVLVREGVSQLDLRPLCLQNSDVVLLELPFVSPPVWLYEEIENIAFEQGLRVMLAHVDRYMTWYSSDKVSYLVDTPGLIVQLNGENILGRRSFRLLRRWLPQTERIVLGSDMHNGTDRTQNRAAVCRRLSRSRIGRQWLAAADSFSAQLIE